MGKKGKGKSKDKPSKKERKRTAGALLAARQEAAEPATLRATTDVVAADRGGPLGSVDPTELAARLAHLSTVLQRELARSDTGDGLTRARLSALSLLVLGGPRTLGSLAAAERVRPPTMTRLINAMESDGLVVRERNPSDGRSIIVRATPAGEHLLERGRARQIAPLADRISNLDRSERRHLETAAELLGHVLRDTAREKREPIP